ncbi:GNAT family N-acetyltransferase [Anaerocolumna xylanovorans]|uniref:N-acetylglutamate synthase, GNAT family n=1 Tax=Anaerocolumna xylanovorans DSM 12503 TaxID=1121345 RepID=A0A1M7YNM1_9FIRM|nr:GNAT family N-acetyltransferase [Anaerocolumna xylanovorans]SHO54263.1 N-acetylglutamate synthase, GNAT family [Anaerocolumna xylanovorans DSM 12503]
MIQGKVVSDEKNISDIFSIWESVFGMDGNSLIYNGLNVYLILFEGLKEDKPIGAVMLREKENGCLIENLAIIESKRNQQNGEFLLRFAVDKGFQLGYEKIYTETKEKNGNLFEKIGFEIIEDSNMPDETIKYQIMQENFYKRCKH